MDHEVSVHSWMECGQVATLYSPIQELMKIFITTLHTLSNSQKIMDSYGIKFIHDHLLLHKLIVPIMVAGEVAVD